MNLYCLASSDELIGVDSLDYIEHINVYQYDISKRTTIN